MCNIIGLDFSQWHRYFSLYDEGHLLDCVGWYSVTPERIANQIANQITERCRCETIVDAFCGMGGNAIVFTQTCERIIAIDNDKTRYNSQDTMRPSTGLPTELNPPLETLPSLRKHRLGGVRQGKEEGLSM